MSSAVLPIRDQVRLWGPGSGTHLGPGESVAYCRALAGDHYENFSVLSSLVPRSLRDDFAAVYAFCRWSDDLSDEIGDPERSRELLGWWRSELEGCFAGSPTHPVMCALEATIRRHELPERPFHDLIDAFVQDQEFTRYETWTQLLHYCSRSADPVGRLVLMMLGEPREASHFGPSDHICTALQLTNHWQDVSRDILQRDRLYIPSELIIPPDFESRLLRSARQGYAVDERFLEESRAVIRLCVDRTESMFQSGSVLLDRLAPRSRPVIRLFLEGGCHVLGLIRRWNYETAIHRPRLSRIVKFGLVARAWTSARLAGGGA